MILLDLSNVAISNIMMSPNLRVGQVDDLLIKHMILNSIKGHKKRFSTEYGDIVICCDSGKYWRRDVFPHYKAARKKGREDSGLNWKDIFTTIKTFKQELKDNFPYKVIEVEGAEADDVIAVLAKNTTEPTIIIGSDKDFIQLHSKYVKQYSSTKKKYITSDNPLYDLRELIITGDKGDGVPNIRSDSDTFVTDKRQAPIRVKEIEQWITYSDATKFCESRLMLENYKRNEELINFDFIPEYITKQILDEYNKQPIGNKVTMLNYFVTNRMKLLAADLQDF